MIYRPPLTLAYLRASTLKQDISPEAQRATIEAQASGLRLFVDSYFEDVGESGSKRFGQRIRSSNISCSKGSIVHLVEEAVTVQSSRAPAEVRLQNLDVEPSHMSKQRTANTFDSAAPGICYLRRPTSVSPSESVPNPIFACLRVVQLRHSWADHRQPQQRPVANLWLDAGTPYSGD